MRELRNYIDGAWADSSHPDRIRLVDPTTETPTANLPAGCAEDVDLAVGAASKAQPAWDALGLEARLVLLSQAADALEASAQDLARLEYIEMGKPVAIGKSFIDWGIAELRDSVRQARDFDFETITESSGFRTTIVHRPLGVVALIVPWNFTVTSILLAVGPLLACGNTVVIKPSEKAPLSAQGLLESVALPPGVMNMVLGDGRAGAPLAAHPDVGLVHFTGSVASGREVGAASGRSLHRAILELGGKDPVVIDSDVDPVAVAAAVAEGAFVNTGQICTSMERIYVHASIAEDFTAALVREADAYTQSSSAGEDAVMGPLVDRRQRDVVHAHVTEAVAQGARILAGGTVPTGRGFFYPATVLTDVQDDMLVMTEETFGPVAPIRVVHTFEEGIALAGRSVFGLAATVYTKTPDHIAQAGAIPAGIVWVNQWQGGGITPAFEPSGLSGMGATGGHRAFDAATRPEAVVELMQSPGSS